MEETKQAIQNTMQLFDNYLMLISLSANEKKSVEQALKNIAGTAIMETKRKTDIFTELYKEVMI